VKNNNKMKTKQKKMRKKKDTDAVSKVANTN
jgi:hypothetical protein